MAEELPIKYVKDKDGRFIPITSPNAVINSDGKNINEIFVSYRKGATAEVEINELLEKVYPIGSVYMSFENNSPASFLGGTWELQEEVFLFGASANYPVGSTGGEATHLLTVDEIPSHSHIQRAVSSDGNQNTWFRNSGGSAGGVRQPTAFTWKTDCVNAVHTENRGGGQSFDIMPPYLATYIWKRIS